MFEEGSFALARGALPNAPEALANADVGAGAERTAVVAPLAPPWATDLIRKIGTLRRAAVVYAAVPRPYLASSSRQLQQTIFDLRRADLTFVERGGGALR